MCYNFRTINYLGSKLRILDFIEDHVGRVIRSGDWVCDLFAGSGCVTFRLSRKFSVMSCDIQTYSHVIANALLRGFPVTEKEIIVFMNDVQKVNQRLLECFTPLIEREERAIAEGDLFVLAEIIEHGSIEVSCLEPRTSSLSSQQRIVYDRLAASGLNGVTSQISRYYGGVYFSYRQAVELDAMLEVMNRRIDPSHRDLFLAALLSTASDIAYTVGKHFAQPLKARDSGGEIKRCILNKAVRDKMADIRSVYLDWLRRYMAIPRTQHGFKVMQGDYMDCLRRMPSQIKTIYADPPYTRDHYSRFYHVLETMALRDNPSLSRTTIHGSSHISNGIYRDDRHQSPFCIRSQAPEAFRNMFTFAAETGRSLLLSYSPYDETRKTHPRVVTMQQILSWAKDSFAHVEMVSPGAFKHNKLNSTSHLLEAADEAELLIVCTH